jgi:hypothetical protein
MQSNSPCLVLKLRSALTVESVRYRLYPDKSELNSIAHAAPRASIGSTP